ncbi:hypothetical protein SSCG_05258 [Streptomyces clavuligerus]|nr:hypothetical protein SSCG_05258 [Streptomyces clavuligerus]
MSRVVNGARVLGEWAVCSCRHMSDLPAAVLPRIRRRRCPAF